MFEAKSPFSSNTQLIPKPILKRTDNHVQDHARRYGGRVLDEAHEVRPAAAGSAEHAGVQKWTPVAFLWTIRQR